ncbi:MAG: hypothetical protein JW982_07045 [Spirochaetes bacterium]|nr:hypothetical protein [Spirochaetota bacterium]
MNKKIWSYFLLFSATAFFTSCVAFLSSGPFTYESVNPAPVFPGEKSEHELWVSLKGCNMESIFYEDYTNFIQGTLSINSSYQILSQLMIYTSFSAGGWYGENRLYDHEEHDEETGKHLDTEEGMYAEPVRDPFEFYGGTLQANINIGLQTNTRRHLFQIGLQTTASYEQGEYASFRKRAEKSNSDIINMSNSPYSGTYGTEISYTFFYSKTAATKFGILSGIGIPDLKDRNNFNSDEDNYESNNRLFWKFYLLMRLNRIEYSLSWQYTELSNSGISVELGYRFL